MEINANELMNQLQTGNVILIDVRSAKEFKKEHLPNAVNIDFYNQKFEDEFHKLSHDKTIVLYCNHGERSDLALTFLASVKIQNVFHLKGGIAAWKKCGLKIE
jgi:rhodanese-related sulfurtransferase